MSLLFWTVAALLAENCKYCSSCNEMKLREDFNKNRASNDGLQTYCRECAKRKRNNP